MVGRLVQQQHRRLRDQRLRQRNPLPCASRQRGHNRIAVKMQPVQRLGHPLLPIPSVLRLYRALQGIQVPLAPAVGVYECDGIRNPDADDLKHRGAEFEHGLLCNVGKPQVLLKLQRAVIRLLKPRQDLQQ